MGRLESGAPLLFNHDPSRAIGCVDSARLDGKRGMAKVRFSKSAEAQSILQDVQDGILRNVSVGYRIYDAEEDKVAGRTVFRVTNWEPMEVSIVTIPADTTVGVGRAANSEEREIRLTKRNTTMADEPTTQPASTGADAGAETRSNVEVVVDRDAILKTERTRIAELQAIINQFPETKERVTAAIRSGEGVDSVRSWFMTEHLKAKPVTSSAPALGTMERESKARYSLAKLALRLNSQKDPEGFEAEVDQELRKHAGGRAILGTMVPSAVFGLRSTFAKRDAVSPATAGGYTVGTDLMPEEFIETLENPPIIDRVGARRLTGLVGDVVIPRQTAGLTAYWLSEAGTVTNSAATYGQLVLTPKRLQVCVPWTRQLAIQSSLDVEALLRTDAQLRIAQAIDTAAMQGLGASGQPKGLFTYNTSTSGINTITYGGAATYAKTREAVGTILTDNALMGECTFLISPSAWAKWSTAFIDTGSGRTIWEGTHEAGNIGGYRGIVSQFLPSNKSVTGCFSQMLIGYWEGVDVLVDPYSEKKSGIIEMTATTHLDIAVRYPESFCVSTDTAAA